MEIGLLHASRRDRDLAERRRAQPEDHTAFELRADRARVDGSPAIDGTGDTMHAH
jgi:hypothetical protein